ncbi:MAG TPA: VWA domain-containing protein [Xanthobacteraceae bacterium]|nr:VWA domain-containing protein [Xanthobacteraceae bacterium]
MSAAPAVAENIIAFARALRAAGLKLGPGSAVDAVEAVETAGFSSREDFYWTLHAVLVKRHEDDPVFDSAFRLFWRRRDPNEAILSEMLPLAPTMPAEKSGQRRVQEALEDAGVRAMPRPRREQELTYDMRGTASDLEVLAKKDFAQMSAAEIREARRLIAKLPFAREEMPSRRLVIDPRGRRIDLRRTLRASLRAGGDLIDLKRRATGRRTPPLVALVDISGSMSDYSRVVLHFLHALTEARGNVATFLFGTRLTNVTRALARRDPDAALASCSAAAKDWSGGTWISSSLHAFNKNWSRRVLAGGATVLLVTDGLEREGGEALSREMERLHRSARRLIWLNPLLRYEGFEPKARGIRAMLPHVDEMRPAHNLASLEGLCAALATQ